MNTRGIFKLEDPLLTTWMDRVAEKIRSIEFHGKSLGFRASLKFQLQGSGDAATEDLELNFSGHAEVFAPFRSAPLIDHRLRAQWVKSGGSWWLRAPSEGATGKEPPLPPAAGMRSAGGEVGPVLDPLTAVVFGLTWGLACGEGQAPASATPFLNKIYLYEKQRILIVPVEMSKERLDARFDRTKVQFRKWDSLSYTEIAVNDPRLPFSASLVRSALT